MELAEFLCALNKNELVFVGSKSAFFFIGYPSEFESWADRLNSEWLKKFKTTARNARNKWKNALLNDRIKRTDEQMQELQDSAIRCQANLDAFVDFRNRVIVETYRNLNDDGTIIIVQGEECGRFWLKTEWEHYVSGETINIEEDSDE